MSTLTDALDVLRHVRRPGAVLRAVVPGLAPPRRVLNDGPASAASAAGAGERAASLRALTRRLEGEALDEQGRIDYRRLRARGGLEVLDRETRALATVTPGDLTTDAERLAFWINVYNVLLVHGILALGLERSVMEEPSFFGTVAYRIGPGTFTPDDVEHGVLRRNAPNGVTGKPQLPGGDPRLAFLPERLDARIHLALVCGAVSCPPVRFYDAAQLDAQLDLATRAFVDRDCRVDDARREIEVSVIFKYYRSDFDAAGGVLAFIAAHLDADAARRVEQARAAGFRLVHRRYDWSLNASTCP